MAARCASKPPRARCGCRPMPWCWPWAAAAGRGWARMAPGCRCWSRAAWRWRRCCRPTAVSTWPCSASCHRTDRPCRCRPCRPRRAGASIFASRYAGQPFKTVAIRCADGQGRIFERKGEFVATATGVEGSLIYAASAPAARRDHPHRPCHAVPGPAARHAGRARAGRGVPPARLALAVQPPQEPAGHRRHQGRHPARGARQGRDARPRHAGADHQGAAATVGGGASARRGHQQRRWRAVRSAERRT